MITARENHVEKRDAATFLDDDPVKNGVPFSRGMFFSDLPTNDKDLDLL